jgi:hypothetical protein
VRVVDNERQRALAGGPRQQREHRQSGENTLRRGPGAHGEHGFQGVPLRGGQVFQEAKQRPA